MEDVGAAVEGVAEDPEFSPPNMAGALVAGGGPAGVVDGLPNNEPPAGAGVVDVPAFPNKLDPEAAPEPPPPKRPPPDAAEVVPGAAGFGVEEAPPNKGVDD